MGEIGEKLKQAGMNTAMHEFHVALVAALQRHGRDPSRAQHDGELQAALWRYAEATARDMTGKPQGVDQITVEARKRHVPAERPQLGDGEDQGSVGNLQCSADVVSEPHRGGTDQKNHVTHHAGVRPVREPSAGAKAASAHAWRETTFLDTFKLRMPSGGDIAIGDVLISTALRLASWNAKQAWIHDKQSGLLASVAEYAARQANIPDGAKIRDICTEAQVRNWAILIAKTTVHSDDRVVHRNAEQMEKINA